MPIVTNTGVYGGIDRATATICAPPAYDAQTRTRSALGTQVNSTTIRPMLNAIMTKHSRGRDHADL